MRHRDHMKPKREKWAKHHVHCACGDALREVLAVLEKLRDTSNCDYDHHGYCQAHGHLSKGLCPQFELKRILAKYATTVLLEKGGAPNTQTSLNPGVNKGRRDSRKPKHTTSGTTNLAGPQISMAPEPRRAERSRLGLPPVPVRADGKDPMDRETGRSPVAKVESNPSAAMPTGAIPISHAWLDNRCARCGHEHEGPCPFCECPEHVEPVDAYDVEVARALEDAARNPSL